MLPTLCFPSTICSRRQYIKSCNSDGHPHYQLVWSTPPLTCYETVVQDTIAMIASSVEGRGEDLGEEVLEQIFSKSGSSLEPSFNLGRFPCHLCSTRIYPVDAGPLRRPVCNRPLARDGPSPSSTDAGRWSRPAIFWLAEEVRPLQQIGTTAHAHK